MVCLKTWYDPRRLTMTGTGESKPRICLTARDRKIPLIAILEMGYINHINFLQKLMEKKKLNRRKRMRLSM